MAVNGRINVDVLFHDTDGTTSLKVVSLEGSTEYTTGKVAIVTGTCGTTAVTVFSGGTTSPAYRDASGAAVTFASINRVALLASPAVNATEPGQARVAVRSSGQLSVVSCFASPESITVTSNSGTASYTLVLYGT
jgi:hypothetical protein